MNAQEFINSGNLEAYCLGLLDPSAEQTVLEMCAVSPEVRQELDQLEMAMEQLAFTLAVKPARDLKKDILDRIDHAESETLDKDHLPVIDHDADHHAWLSAFRHLIRENPIDNLLFYPLTNHSRLKQSLVFTRMNIPDETHADLKESFFILEGTCTCTVGGLDHFLKPGDFLEIPLHIQHDIQLTAPYVVAILQQQPCSA